MTYPTIPVEVPYTDIERDMIENEPPGAFPEDQNSYWGQVRKLFADYLQANALDLFNAWYNNIDPRNVDANDIAEWEYRVGVPGDRSSITLASRRAFVQNRLKAGAFSRALVNSIIETFITPTFGASTAFDPTGIPFGAGGITLFSGVSGDPKTMYRVYYDYMNRIYYVRILNTLGEDLSGLTRELQRITPAGWTLNIAEVANPLYYTRGVTDQAPVLYLPMDNSPNDASGYADNGTFTGAPTSVVALVSTVANNGGGSALSFDAALSQYETVPHAAQLNVGDNFSIEFWVKPTNFTGTPRIIGKGTGWEAVIDTAGIVKLRRQSDSLVVASSSVALVAGTAYHVVLTKRYDTAKVYINGVDRTVLGTLVAFPNNSFQITVARDATTSAGYLTGVLDEVAVYNTVLSPETVLAHYKTGTNVL